MFWRYVRLRVAIWVNLEDKKVNVACSESDEWLVVRGASFLFIIL